MDLIQNIISIIWKSWRLLSNLEVWQLQLLGGTGLLLFIAIVLLSVHISSNHLSHGEQAFCILGSLTSCGLASYATAVGVKAWPQYPAIWAMICLAYCLVVIIASFALTKPKVKRNH